jgi:hypothetical protein
LPDFAEALQLAFQLEQATISLFHLTFVFAKSFDIPGLAIKVLIGSGPCSERSQVPCLINARSQGVAFVSDAVERSTDGLVKRSEPRLIRPGVPFWRSNPKWPSHGNLPEEEQAAAVPPPMAISLSAKSMLKLTPRLTEVKPAKKKEPFSSFDAHRLTLTFKA